MTQAQLQQVTDRVPYRDRQGMVPDLAFHGLGGTSAQYYELKGLRASKNTYPRGPNTGVAKRAASVQVEHVRKLRKLDQKLYGTDIDSASPPGPLLSLLRHFHALGEVHPIVFGAYGEVSEGMEVLIGKLADAWAPQIADQYLLDNVLAADGGHREEHPTGGNRSGLLQRARAHPPWAHEVLPAGLRSGIRAAPGPRRAIQSGSSAGARGTGHRETPGIWWHAPSPVELLVGLAG